MKTIDIDGTAYVASIDAAEYLNVTRQRMSQMVKEGKLPALKLGKAIFIKQTDLLVFADGFTKRKDPVRKDEQCETKTKEKE